MENAIEFLRSFRSGKRPSESAISSESPPLAENKCLEIFMNAAQEIDKRYVPGTIAYVSRNYPELERQIDESESEVNRIWFAVERHKANIEDLRAVIASWYRLNLTAIKIYSERHDQ